MQHIGHGKSLSLHKEPNKRVQQANRAAARKLKYNCNPKSTDIIVKKGPNIIMNESCESGRLSDKYHYEQDKSCESGNITMNKTRVANLEI